ncbi:MAG: T9SS type A sorting domain-containing protein [Bacteroidetes bacterium]|nr:T9SS type A sorting domain-containing protein [Bacteroidota bacterium]
MSRVTRHLSRLCFMLSAFCLLPVITMAQKDDIPDDIFGIYTGDAEITIELLGMYQSAPNVPVELANTGTDYVLKIPDLGLTDSINMNNIVITPFEGGYKLTRAGSITFIIPEIEIPPVPPLFPNGGVFYNVPVVVKLGNTQIVNYVLTLNIEATATVTLYGFPVNIPILIHFEGAIFFPPNIITTTLPNGTVGEQYYAILEADGMKPIIWSIFQGDLPTGLVLDELTGEISGIPTKDSVFQFAVMATNTSGNSANLFTIEIEEEQQDTTGIANSTIMPLKIFPNPTTGQLTITNYELRITNVEVFDIYGRNVGVNLRVRSHTAENSPPFMEGWQPQAAGVVNISHLPTGIYFVKITTEKGAQMLKVMKL